MCKIGSREVGILLIRRWLQQAGGVHPLAAFGLDQIMAAENVGDPQLGGLEVDPFDLFDDLEDRVPATLRDARTEGSRLALVPAPGGVLIRVIGIGAGDVRCAVLPRDPQGCEDSPSPRP